MPGHQHGALNGSLVRRQAKGPAAAQWRRGPRWLLLGLAVAVPLVLGACSPRHLLVKQLADELASQGQAPEDDLTLARDAAPFYLKLSESVLRQSPGHLGLAEAVASGFTQYAYAFVGSEAERLATRDARAALQLRSRAARLYARAQRHAMAALEAQQPGFAAALASATPPRLAADQVGVAYWAAAAWALQISMSTDRPELVADLPLAMRLAGLAYALQPEHGHGNLAALMGSLEAARPGGSAQAAQAYFDRAMATSAGRNAGVLVAQAEALALPAGDRARFEALLRQALATTSQARAQDQPPAKTDDPAPLAKPRGPDQLADAALRERAQWLLDNADDLF